LTGLRGYARISIGRETPGQSVKPERTTDMSNLTVKTNNVPRLLIDAYELSEKERAEFDYLDWEAIDKGEDSATFFRYKGQLFDLGEFSRDYGITKGTGLPDHLSKWDGYMSDTFFSAYVVRYVEDDSDRIIVGRVYS
jgi:hypothetical protein